MTTLFVAALFIGGCGEDEIFTASNGADYVFVVLANYTSEDGVRPIDDLLGLSDIERTSVSYEVEDSSIISVDASGKITTPNLEEKNTTYLTVKYSNYEEKIKVVVVGDYDSTTYMEYKNLYIPYGISEIGEEYAGSEIEKLNIPSSVKKISDGAFYNCVNLNEVHIEDGITSIPNNIFYDCTSLKYVTIPDTVTMIRESAFRDCDKIETINLNNNITLIDSFAFYSCNNLKSIDLPDSLTYIGDRAFCNCTSLEEIIIPEGVTKINNDTFSSCSSLSKLTLSNSITNIGERAFLNCKSLTELTLPESVESLGLDAFSGCIGIKSMTLPITLNINNSSFPSVASVEYFRFTGKGAGADYTAGTYVNTPWYISRNHKIRVDIDEGVTSIGDYTFVYCYGLVEINLPNSLNRICHGAFRKCFNLENIVIPDNVTTIELHAFSLDYELTNVTFSKNLYEVGPYAFYGCTALSSLDLPDTITVIGQYAFSECNALTYINIGTSQKCNLKYIGERAFAGFLFDCKEVNIYGTKIKYIASGAFGYIGDEKPESTMATLARDSVIKVSSSSIKNKFVADKNYYSKDTKIVVR